MIYYRCKCGKSELFGSLSPARCDACADCGSNLARHPDLHFPPEPHDFVPTPVETDEGMKTLSRCKYCGKTANQLAREER